MTNFPRFSGLPEQLKSHAERIYRLERRPGSAASTQPNLVPNGSFESVDAVTGDPLQWSFFWKTGSPSVGSSTTAYEGSLALSVSSTIATDVQRSYSEPTPAVPGMLYYWQFAVRKTAGVGNVDVVAEITFGDGPALLPFGGDILGNRVVFSQPVATAGAYTLYSGYVSLSDPLTTYATMELRAEFSAIGQTVLFDAAEFKAVPAIATDPAAPAIGASRYLGAAQILANATPTAINLDTSVYSNGVGWDSTNDEFQIGVAGLYQINGQIRWTSGGVLTTRRIGSLWVNGASVLDTEGVPSANSLIGCTIAKGVRLEVGDTVSLVGQHTNGGNFNVFGLGTQASGTFMELHYVGA